MLLRIIRRRLSDLNKLQIKGRFEKATFIDVRRFSEGIVYNNFYIKVGMVISVQLKEKVN